MVMKRFLRIFLVVVAAAMLPDVASAQFDLGKALGKLLEQQTESSAVPKVSPYDAIVAGAPARSKILGTWQYKTATLEYLGDNPLASAAIKQLEGFGLSELKNRGVVEGCCSLTLRRNGLAVLATRDTLQDAEFLYNDETAVVNVSTVVGDVVYKAKGYLRIVNENLIVMIDARDALNLIEKSSPELSGDQTFLTAKGILQSLSDIYLSALFVR